MRTFRSCVAGLFGLAILGGVGWGLAHLLHEEHRHYVECVQACLDARRCVDRWACGRTCDER